MDNQFRFYNTLTRKIETVIPHEDGKIKMYTCGPTVYHFAHRESAYLYHGGYSCAWTFLCGI